MSLFLDVYLCAVLICSLGLLSIFLFTLVLICQYFYRRHRLKCKTTSQSNCRFMALCFPHLYLKQTVTSNVCLYCFFLYSQLPSGQMSRKQVLVCSLFRNQKAGGETNTVFANYIYAKQTNVMLSFRSIFKCLFICTFLKEYF